MDKEQFKNRNSAGQDPTIDRTLKNQQRITAGMREDRGIIRQPVTRRS